MRAAIVARRKAGGMVRRRSGGLGVAAHFSSAGSIQWPSSCSFHAESIIMFVSTASGWSITNCRPAAVCACEESE